MALLAPVVAAAASAVAVWLSAFVSPERSVRKDVFHLINPRRPAKVGFPAPQGRAIVGLIGLGMAMGLAIAMGLAPGSVFVLLGAFAACTAGRFLLGGGVGIAPLWLMTLGWAMLGSAYRFETVDLPAVAGAQMVLGPAAFLKPPAITAVSIAAAVIGILAGAFWVESHPGLNGDGNAPLLDAAIRWGESAIVAISFASFVWGPSVGGLVYGPHQPASLLRGAESVAIMFVAVLAVSWGRRIVRRFEQRSAAVLLGPLAFAALVIAVLVR